MSNIEWTGDTWNPIVGCSRISDGCKNCYAETMTKRLAAMGLPKYQGLLNEQGRFNGETRFDEDALLRPLKRKKPTTYFVNSMSDLFHGSIPDEWIDKVFAVMALCPQHTFQVLTKRVDRMREYVTDLYFNENEDEFGDHFDLVASHACELVNSPCADFIVDLDRPLPNVWLGVSTENQEQADARIPYLLDTPAAVRFVSAEPLLSEMDFDSSLGGTQWVGGQRGCGGTHHGNGSPDCPKHLHHHHDTRCKNGLDWIIVGGESGAGARPCRVEHIRSIVRQCKAADVPVFVKQLGSNAMGSALIDAPPFPCSVEMTWNGAGVGSYSVKFNNRKGGDMSEWPEDLRIREMPK